LFFSEGVSQMPAETAFYAATKDQFRAKEQRSAATSKRLENELFSCALALRK